MESRASPRYRTLELLGRGGMGSVHRALDTKLERTVALKRLHLPQETGRHQRLIEFFHQEYRTLTQLAHPYIVSVYDYGVDEHGPYYAMELLTGNDLQQLAPLPYRQACTIIRDVCSAAALLHSRRLLHRDLSPKNVRCTDEGRTKLIDFGAMSAMGVVTTLIGTPPMIPPEALLQQSLDANADLYAIGATLYFVLTGHHAFPARDIAQLQSLWAEPIVPPSLRRPDIPRQLDELVLSLLHPHPLARPRSAVEVSDRLTAIAQLPSDNQLGVQAAYLATPELVGREQQLATIREVIRDLRTGAGGALLITGAPGMGRSRMLDAAVLEAKLADVVVVRVSAAHGGDALYGVLGALVSNLTVACESVMRDQGGLLRRLANAEIDLATDQAHRAALHAELQASVRSAAQQRPLVLAIDDLDRCDHASQAALAALAHACQRSPALVCVTTAAGAERDNSALSLLAADARVVEVGPLRREQTASLLGSVFGDVPNLQATAIRVHESAEGSPRASIELAQYLVDRDVVQYHQGSFSLPTTLDASHLQVSLSDMRRAKLVQLPDDARELAEALVAAHGSGLELAAYPELTTHGDPDRVGTALNALLLAQIVRGDGVHYSFEALVWLTELRADSQLRERALYARVADALERRGRDRLEIAQYRVRAGQLEGALDLLATELALGSRWDRSPRDYAELLIAAIAACPTLGRARIEEYRLRRELVKVGADLHVPHMREHLQWLFVQLASDSGLSYAQELDPNLSATERLTLTFQHAQQRYERASLFTRGLAPAEAIQALSWLAAETVAISSQIGDLALLELVPALKVFHPLSPQIERIDVISRAAAHDVIAGRYERACARHTSSLEAVIASTGGDEATRQWAIHVLTYGLGCIEGGLGRAQALHHADYIEQVPGWIVPAHAVRRIYYGMLGDLRESGRWQKQIEVMLLQSPIKPPLAAGASHQQLYIAALTDNVIGLRNAIAELGQLAKLHPAFSPFVTFARAQHACVCGGYEEALSLLEPLLARLEPGSHPIWPWAAGVRIRALFGLGHYEQAHAVGLRDCALAEREELISMKEHITLPLALVEAALGQTQHAYERATAIAQRREQDGMHGANPGYAYEVSARVAIMMGDATAFASNAERCALHYSKAGYDSALIAKYELLMQEARRGELHVDDRLLDAVAPRTSFHTTAQGLDAEPEAIRIARALRECTSVEERDRTALSILLERSGAVEGHLFLAIDERLALSASSGGTEPSASVSALAEAAAAQARAWHDDDDADDTIDFVETAPVRVPEESARTVAVRLMCERGAKTMFVGIAVLRFESRTPVHVPIGTATGIARAWPDEDPG